MPAVSILVPTYRLARYLPETLDSILAQDFRDFEVILADDNSGDGSAEILRTYAARDARLRIARVHEQNLGMVPNWNWCLAQARAPLVHYLFGDDRFSTNLALGNLVSLLEAHPSAALATSARRLIDADSKPFGSWHNLAGRELHRAADIGRRCLLEGANLIGEPSAVLFRHRPDLTGFDARFRQIVDLELWLRLLRHGDLAVSHEMLCDFRVHEAQATAANRRPGLVRNEYAWLLADYLPHFLPLDQPLDGFARRGLFAALHNARKAELSPEQAAVLARHRHTQLPGLSFLGHSLRFKLSRPLVNLRLSLQKRLGRPPLEWSYASGFRPRQA